MSYLPSITNIQKILSALFFVLTMSSLQVYGQDADHENDDVHEDGAAVSLSPSQLSIAGIVVEAVSSESISLQLNAPGEVVNNKYRTAYVAPKITAQVVARHVALGEEVEKGKALVTLYSVDLLKIQSELLIAHREWLRVGELGEQTVGARRFTEARAVFEELSSQAGAYGMSEQEIEDSLIGQHDDHKLGEFDLVAPEDGVVLSDDFILGQTIEAGQTLITLVDESTVWVEAALPPDIGYRLPASTSALVSVQGSIFEGKIIQQSHMIDEATRTWTVRIQIDNSDHNLHAGLFVDVLFTSPSEVRGIVVPESALMRLSDGDWTVFVEVEPGEFMQTEIEVLHSFPGSRVIGGLPENARIAVEGAFFIASEMAKGGFDPHDH